MSILRIVSILIGISILLGVISSAQAEAYCGATVGYNLTRFANNDIVVDRHNNGYFDYFSLCGHIRNARCLTNYVGCETLNNDTVVINWGYEALTAPWSYVNSSNPLQGVIWTTDYVSNVISNYADPVRRARLTITCNSNAVNPIAEAYNEAWDSADPWMLTTYYRVQTNLVCGDPVFSPPTSGSSTGSGNSFPASSTSAIVPILSSSGGYSNVTCPSTSLQAWYFSYTAIISSTSTINFYGTFYTASGIPAGILLTQVLQLQATWVITLNGVVTIIPVTVLNPSFMSGVNLNGGTLFPLQGQSWSFYVGAELVTIGGPGIYPVILNSTTVVQSGAFTYSNNPQHVGQGGC